MELQGIVYADRLKWDITDINLIPKEFTDVVITPNKKKIGEAVKKFGINFECPGIVVYKEKMR